MKWSQGRVCKGCQEFKPLSEYNLRKSGTPYTLCKVCYRIDLKRRAVARGTLPDTHMRNCSDCSATKIITEFPRNANSAGGYLNRCKKCYARRNSLNTWGIDIYKYTNCGVCNEELDFGTPKLVVVDHDHSCCSGNKSCGQCVRGVLCSRCNVGLGMFRDNPQYLRLAAEYLERSESEPSI